MSDGVGRASRRTQTTDRLLILLGGWCALSLIPAVAMMGFGFHLATLYTVTSGVAIAMFAAYSTIVAGSSGLGRTVVAILVWSLVSLLLVSIHILPARLLIVEDEGALIPVSPFLIWAIWSFFLSVIAWIVAAGFERRSGLTSEPGQSGR